MPLYLRTVHGVLHCESECKAVRYKYQYVWCESYSQVTAGIGVQTHVAWPKPMIGQSVICCYLR